MKIQQKTHISHVLEGNDYKDRYDAEVKKILSDKTILAWIMKYSMEEFADYTIEEARECIEGTPEVATVKVRPGHTPEAITGMPNEDKVPGEGEITYDIRFYVITRKQEHIKIIVNVEAQNEYYPGYDLVTRAIFYCARMLSAQLDTEFVPRNYDDIKKVYSIWICMDAPKYAEYTITSYKMNRKDLYGHMAKEARYDLLEAVMICLGDEAEVAKGNSLHGMLSTLLTENPSPSEKERILEREYDIATTVELKGGIDNMCNLSVRIEQKGVMRGIEQGIEQGIEHGIELNLCSLVKKGLLKIEDAAKELNVSVEEFAEKMEKAGY